MIEEYLVGSIQQSLERIRQLKNIIQNRYPREYDGLRQNCLNRLDRASDELNALRRERIVDSRLQTPRRVRAFKRVVERVHDVESIGVFALNRAGTDDNFLNRLITGICDEIKYPLLTPVISQTSQDYFHVYSDFNLLCLPLIESRFLLHLPDIYHELCHPIHRSLDLTQLSGYEAAFSDAAFAMVRHFQADADAADRLGNQDGRLFQIQLWRTCWSKSWLEEMFCDLFGLTASGPAYAWSHYHLCVKRGSDPFQTPLTIGTTHPADDARMRALVLMLRKTEAHRKDAAMIERAWREFCHVMNYRPSAEYRQCYAEGLLVQIVDAAHRGIRAIEVIPAADNPTAPIIGLLNQAWTTFWNAPIDYQQWETDRVKGLRDSLNTRP
ncbi:MULTISPECIES: hypothetical protein [unclassified Bradyrhizobium]|uniref:hypothetical protein n=1 Tax=Bradyrhizobium sp. USDA 4541 TaxID=2817704 RepID=UPI0020A29537|nr:hypothetical protein [Bradyrhizobium sp. USDA 4541]MCP1854421.1 hypothetical protein [Bradyrhizobium sp. USDA 4541]